MTIDYRLRELLRKFHSSPRKTIFLHEWANNIAYGLPFVAGPLSPKPGNT
jgi:hypothetical protein